MMTYNLSKLHQTALVLVCDQTSSRGLCTIDYKSLHVAPFICPQKRTIQYEVT